MEQATDEDSNRLLPTEKYYQIEELHSRPFITPDSDIPEKLLHLWHSFGYDSGRRANLQLLDDTTLIFIAGNILVLIDTETKDQRYLRSCSGGGIGALTAYPTKEFFAVAEKGNQPNIIVYEYPSLRPYRILKGGTECAYSFVDFNLDGSLLASVGSTPDYMLTLWDWRQEQVLLSCKAISQEVYRVTFSPYDLNSLTSSGSQHIKFWKMASTFTGLKLQGQIGRFGKTSATDIEGYVEFPDGKVLSGSTWGNLLLWDGSTIKVEICRKDGRSCHVGMAQPFALEDELVMTMGSDGIIRGWDFESINTASGSDNSSRFEIEPINEMMVGHNVSLSFAVKSSVPDSFTWFAQDSRGAIWKMDLSFLSLAPDPECLFCFHAGPIKGLDVSKHSYLMATTTLDRLVKVFDFLSKKELTSCNFNQGGTTISWAPPSVDQSGGLLITGFEDGVVRLLDLYDPQKLHEVHERRPIGEAKLRLKQAFKPHNAPVTAVAFERNGTILATGSSDSTVFFFVVGEKYNPIGFVHVPGPVQALEWSPDSHSENRLLVLCQNGYVVEVHCPDLKAQKSTKTYKLSELPSRSFRFRSIKSQIKRNMEIARRQALKEQKKKEKEAKMIKPSQLDTEQKEEEELPPIYIPDPPSPLYCGFYSQPNQFWLSMGGFDAGFLYHCKFSVEQDQDFNQQQDEPFDFLPVDNAENDPICSITFSSNRQLMLCGMYSGFIRVYPLQSDDYSLSSMQAYWALSVHDNQYGHLQHIKWSHDDQFVLTAGDDGNIFSFSLTPPEQLQKSFQRMRAKVPSPRPGFESEELAWDIEDPAAYSIETAKQKLEEDRLRKEAEKRLAGKRKKLAELRHKYQEMLKVNQSLSEHVHLTPEEFQLNQRFSERVEKVKVEVRKQMSWPLEHSSIALNKLQDGYRDQLETNMVVTVVAIGTNDIISTYPLPQPCGFSLQLNQDYMTCPPDIDVSDAGHSEYGSELSNDSSKLEDEEGPSSVTSQAGTNPSELTEPSEEPIQDSKTCSFVEDASAAPADEQSKTGPEEEDDILEDEDEDLCPPMARTSGVKLTAQQEERLRKADERAVKARAEIVKRKEKWAQLYAEMPGESWEDPQCVEAIRRARENIGDLKLKSDEDYVMPKNLRMNAEQKRAQLISLETKIRQEKTEMNKRIIVLRDSKIDLVAQLHSQAQQVREVQKHLAAHLHCPVPTVPTLLPMEIPEKRFQCSHATLKQYHALKEQRTGMSPGEHERAPSLLEQLEKDMKGQEVQNEERLQEKAKEESLSLSAFLLTLDEKEEEEVLEEGVGQSELEEMVQREEDLKLLHEQRSLLEQMERSVRHFDMEHQLLRHENLRLCMQLNMADLQQLMLYQELLLLEESKWRRDSLQEKLNGCIKEENNIMSKLEESVQQLEMKRAEILNLQEKETAMIGALQSSLNMNKFKEYLTKVFWKKIKNVKKKGQTGDEEEDDEDDEDDSEDSDDSDEDAVDDTVCCPGCDPDLFEYVLKLRKRRIDLEELLAEKKRSSDALKRKCDFLTEKEKLSKSSLRAAEDDLELLYKEDQQKMNSLDVMIPLHLNQVAFESNSLVPSDLSQAVLLNKTDLRQLQERIEQRQVKNKEQRVLNNKARQQVVRLTRDIKDKRIRLQEVKQESQQLMMMKFGKLVNMDALMTIGGNRRLEELKQEKHLRETAHTMEIKLLKAKVDEARHALNEIIIHNTELLRRKRSFIDQRRGLEQKINVRQRKLGRQLQDQWRIADQEILRLQEIVNTQSQKAEALRKEISLLAQKGGHVLPPDHMRLPSVRPRNKRHSRTPDYMRLSRSPALPRKRQTRSTANTELPVLSVLPTNKKQAQPSTHTQLPKILASPTNKCHTHT